MNPSLDAVEKGATAAFTQLAGRELPARFGDLQHEWGAVRQQAGLLDARFRALVRLTGMDRITFTQGMLTNDVARLVPGMGTYAALLTQQGKIVSDLYLYALPEELWLDVPVQCADTVRAALERYIVADDVEFASSEGWQPLIAIEGPDAARIVLAMSGERVNDVPPFAHREVTIDGVQLRIAATSHAGEQGYVLFGAEDVGASVWQRARATGAVPIGMDALDVLRLEAGIPWYGRDMDQSTLISEVGLTAAVSFTKGCYLGQEVVERVAARGQVQRALVGLLCDGQTAPAPGAKITGEGKDIGAVTSAAWSPARRAVIALAYVRRGYWEPATAIDIATGEGCPPIAARVTPLPFYRRR